MVNETHTTYYFKFYSFGEYAKDTLIHLMNNQIYAPSVTQMNDPFEDRWYGCDLENLMNRQDPDMRGRVDRRGVFCLCSSTDSNFPLSKDAILMWSHYADSHKGFCVMFSDKILKSDAQDFVKMEAKYIKEQVEIDQTIAYSPESNDELLRIIEHKSDIWERESEVRLCYPCSGEYHKIEDSAIIAIFCGCNISDYNKALLYGIAHYKNWQFYELRPHNKEFKFEYRNQ